MKLGPHPANLKGELALEQMRAVQEATWPGVQRDLEVGRVRELRVAEVVPTERALTRTGGAYGVQIAPNVSPAPAAPNLVALPGRYRAWVLPISAVAVALEPLDDEAVYLRAYRADVLAVQGIASDADLGRLGGTVDEVQLLKKTAHANTVEFGQFPPDNLWVNETLFGRLFAGLRYRRRRRWFRSTILEPIAPELVTTHVGPYR